MTDTALVVPAIAQVLGVGEGSWGEEEQFELFRRPYHQAYEPALAATRAALSSEAFAAAWAEGAVLSLDRATALALQALPASASSSEAQVPPL